MHEYNMDKKQKTEDDKEIIDFMELVEENLYSVGNETICMDKNSENDLLENKPLQPSEENKEMISSKFSDLENKVEECLEEKETEDFSEQLRSLNIEIEKMAKEISFNEEKSKEENFNEEEEIINKEMKSKEMKNKKANIIKEEIINEEANKIKEENKVKENIILNKDDPSLNKEKKVIRFKNDPGLIPRRDDQLELRTDTLDFRIKKYPGFLYIDIYSIEKYISSDTEVRSVFVKLECKDFVYETEDHSEDSTIKFNSLLHLKLDTSDKFTIKFILNKRTEKGIIKSSECFVNVDRDFLDKVHNTLFEINYEWSPYSSSNFFKSLISFFSSEVADAWGLKLFFSFVSEEELKSLKFLPSTLYDLGKFLKIRKYAYNTWFTGFCNIRGFNTNICTHLWKRRFIKIQGYKIFIYNEHTKNLLGIFDLLTTMSKERDIFEEDNKFRIVNNEKMIEFHLESTEKYTQFKKVMEALL